MIVAWKKKVNGANCKHHKKDDRVFKDKSAYVSSFVSIAFVGKDSLFGNKFRTIIGFKRLMSEIKELLL